MRRIAAAKVNLGLAVTGTRPDGYHELSSVFVRLGLGDDLSIVGRTAAGDPDRLEVEGDPAVPVEGNLVLRAAAAVRGVAADGASLPGLRFRLCKRIPMGGGLGGGSADAAAALELAAAAWGVPLTTEGRLTLAARLGADVPFCALGLPAAHVTGIGERIAALPALRSPLGILLVVPAHGLSTPAVFRALDAGAAPGPAALAVVDALARDWPGLDGPAVVARAPALRDANDLWAPVARLDPGLARLRERLERRLGEPLLLTGSGSTLVGLYPSPDAAHDAAARIGRPDPAGDPPFRTIATTDARSAAHEEEPG